MGWFGPRTGDANTCCTHASPCVPCATDSQPTATYTVTIPAGDFGAGTYVLGLRNYLGNGCSWNYFELNMGIYCFSTQVWGLELVLYKPFAGSAIAEVQWRTAWVGNLVNYRADGPGAYFDCADFDAFEIPCATPAACGACTGPATVTAI